MEMFKEMLVLLILITSVINQCLLPVKTGNWSLVIPVILRYTDRYAYNREVRLGTYSNATEEIYRIVWNNFYVRGRGEVVGYGEDFRRLEHKLSQSLRNITLPPSPTIIANYTAVMKHGTFKHGYFLDNQTGHYYAWDRSLEYLSTYYKAEATESVLRGSTTQFITFMIGNGVNFTLQLVERNDDLWTTNEPFLFLLNSSRFHSRDHQNIVLFNIFLKKAQLLFCDPVINIGSANTFENITIVVVILITITIAIIVSAYVLRKKCSRKKRQHMRKSSLVYKKRTNENTGSGYEDAVEVNEYAEIGNRNRIFYDLQGNRVNEILGEEQQEYDYAYSTIKPSKSLGAKENSEIVNNENTGSGYEDAVEVNEYAEIGNTNRIFYDLLGNRVNEILGEEQLENVNNY